jgi:hypothetical protein
MLVLLDENLPQGLRLFLGGHDVRTTRYQGWAGLANGALLKAAEEAGFEVFVTADRGILYQQNRTKSKLALIVLSTNERAQVAARVAEILAAINTAQPGNSAFVDIGS